MENIKSLNMNTLNYRNTQVVLREEKPKGCDGEPLKDSQMILTIYSQSETDPTYMPFELKLSNGHAIELRDFLLYCYPKE